MARGLPFSRYAATFLAVPLLYNPVVAYANHRLAGFDGSSPIFKLRRVVAGDEVDVYGVRGTELLIGGAWSDQSTETMYVTTWYDQSGGGNNATQTTAASQPELQFVERDANGLGSELVTNGDFASGTTGWTVVNGTFSVASEQATLTRTTGNAYVYSSVSIVTGVLYRASVDLIQNTNNRTVRLGTLIGGSATTDFITFTSVGTHLFHFTAVPADGVIIQMTTGVSGDSVVFDNVSIKQVTDPVASLRFDGSNDYLTATIPSLGTGDYSVFLRTASSDVSIGANWKAIFTFGTYNPAFYYTTSTVNTLYAYEAGNHAFNTSLTEYVSKSLCFERDGGTVYAFVDSVQESNSYASPTSVSTDFGIGTQVYNSSSAPVASTFGNLLIFERCLDQNEKDNLHNYSVVH